MNSKYAEGMSDEYGMFLYYINSIWIRMSYRMIPVKGCSFTKSSLYVIWPQTRWWTGNKMVDRKQDGRQETRWWTGNKMGALLLPVPENSFSNHNYWLNNSIRWHLSTDLVTVLADITTDLVTVSDDIATDLATVSADLPTDLSMNRKAPNSRTALDSNLTSKYCKWKVLMNKMLIKRVNILQ